MIKVLPSTNPCDENKLVEYARSLDKLGVEYIHCDVMDGKFVENKCLDITIIKDILHNSNMLLDIHLMVEDVEESVKKHAQLKPSIMTIHIETIKSIKQFKKIADYLKEKDILVGLSIKPNTEVSELEMFIDYIDLILVMSVEPGKSGQKFMPTSLDRIKEIKNMIENKNIIIEVDGGINEDTYKDVVEAGATFLVMGSAFYNAKDKSALLNKIDKHYKISK